LLQKSALRGATVTIDFSNEPFVPLASVWSGGFDALALTPSPNTNATRSTEPQVVAAVRHRRYVISQMSQHPS
jgi:hypothetical protein